MKKTGLLLVFLLNPSLLFAHSYKLDSYGCHNNGALGVYECHSGALAGTSYPNPDGKSKMLAALAALTPPPPAVVLTGEITLTWQVSQNTTGYKMYWSVDQTTWYSIDVANVTTVTFNTALRGATYYFEVTAYNASGESQRSNRAQKALP